MKEKTIYMKENDLSIDLFFTYLCHDEYDPADRERAANEKVEEEEHTLHVVECSGLAVVERRHRAARASKRQQDSIVHSTSFLSLILIVHYDHSSFLCPRPHVRQLVQVHEEWRTEGHEDAGEHGLLDRRRRVHAVEPCPKRRGGGKILEYYSHIFYPLSSSPAHKHPRDECDDRVADATGAQVGEVDYVDGALLVPRRRDEVEGLHVPLQERKVGLRIHT